MRSRKHFLLELYQIAAGFSDTSTGVLLLLAPSWTLRLMHVTQSATPGTFNSFIGTFVLGVGLTYLWVFTRRWRGLVTAAEWESQWRCTAIIRSCVAAFLFGEIAAGHMEPAWSVVAASDATLAIIQWVGLQRGWLLSATRDSVD